MEFQAEKVPSSHGVEVVVHECGGSGPPLLMSHATGFHGRCWAPVADALAHRYSTVAFDYRGHGDTWVPDDADVDWEHYGDDALAVARMVAEHHGGPIMAIGHSMGAACLLIAAYRDPSLFKGLVLFEPIVFPTSAPPAGQSGSGGEGPSLAVGARRRRSSFPSYDAAAANYASKPPMDRFDPRALRAYVDHGFRPGDDGEVHLKCTPEHEARTFETGGTHHTWDVLGEVSTPAWVVSGRIEPAGPSGLAEPIAQRLPNGHYVQLAEVDHFGPMTHPGRIAGLVEHVEAELTG